MYNDYVYTVHCTILQYLIPIVPMDVHEDAPPPKKKKLIFDSTAKGGV